MANIKSKQKRVITNEKARRRNKGVRSAVRTEIRKFREAVATGDKAAAEKQLRVASRALDKSCPRVSSTATLQPTRSPAWLPRSTRWTKSHCADNPPVALYGAHRGIFLA